MWVVPREDTYNPLVPFGDEGIFLCFGFVNELCLFLQPVDWSGNQQDS